MKNMLIRSIDFISILMICVMFLSCNMMIQKNKAFNSKEEAFNAVRNNIDDLIKLSSELYDVFNNKSYIIIENKTKIYDNSIEYQTELCNKIFYALKLRNIKVDVREQKIAYTLNIYNNLDYPIVYYSLNSDISYYSTDTENNNYYFGTNNCNAGFDKYRDRYGWYSEKINELIYYYESYYEGFHCIKYIKDDLKDMKEYKEIYNRFREYFDD